MSVVDSRIDIQDIYVCTCVSICIYVYVYICIRTYTYRHTQEDVIYVYICVCICIHVYACKCIYTYTYRHTQEDVYKIYAHPVPPPSILPIGNHNPLSLGKVVVTSTMVSLKVALPFWKSISCSLFVDCT